MSCDTCRYKEVLLHVNVLYLSASLGLNRIALLTGLMKPVSDNRIVRVVSEDFIQRKVNSYNMKISLDIITL